MKRLTYKIVRKIKIAFRLILDEGVIAFAIRTLEFIQKKRKQKKGSSIPIDTLAIYDEILNTDPSKSANTHWKGLVKDKTLTLNWVMPPPGKGSGGHMTIFRFIKYLESAGHTCRIYLHNPGPNSTVDAVRAVMGDAFPKLNASMEWLKPGEAMEKADGIFATSWQTAYTVYTSKLKAKKYYFVQDFEPYFYPVGSHSILAENTYKLGLRGITAGEWLAKKLRAEYGMTTDHFNFGADSKTYRYGGSSERKGVIFYARPTTERRAFELGVLTLDLFHRKHPEYTIFFVGWDVSSYNIPFPYQNLGILDPEELNNIYNHCSVALVMSLTNMSLLPLELLSSGCIPVVNKGENNSLVSDNKHIEYSDCDPVSLSTALYQAALKNTPQYSKKISDSTNSADWNDSGMRVVSIIESSIKKPGSM